ncbi:CRISPR-associated protein, Csy4 family [Desulfamplus magnetovallimortis]|uniref:CRISPR-associated protein, Csy4 family n=1 Tax=Desulfamplus magnetovallimortis TaxID=1246637 RepID=A0A1W1HHW6_9BACT|nr:type I-F CRISPR-associated endoribonuclease Cas6/Csy4 [Desulfamplus magnetovallimortis]SLM32015.1 CRISPR-associated protein, Csy4 family [Desulfamplus magnetovallimortis]
MDFYIEIKLLPDPEFKETILMNILFSKLHLALTENGHGEIGISFPFFEKTLGDTIRIHGSSSALERIQIINWLQGLQDYINMSDILRVPALTNFRIVKRIQTKSSIERLYRRSIKKGWITSEEAEKRIREQKVQRLKSPYVQIKSLSTGQYFPLFINHGEILKSSVRGEFSAYGLSVANATIPWF